MKKLIALTAALAAAAPALAEGEMNGNYLCKGKAGVYVDDMNAGILKSYNYIVKVRSTEVTVTNMDDGSSLIYGVISNKPGWVYAKGFPILSNFSLDENVFSMTSTYSSQDKIGPIFYYESGYCSNMN